MLVSVEEAKGGLDFNVATAIALAGCAFESYNEPTRVTSKLQERSNNGTVTTYIDRSGQLTPSTWVCRKPLTSFHGWINSLSGMAQHDAAPQLF